MIIIYLILAVFVADLLTGIFHWWEDRYGNPNWPIIGNYIIKPNIIHHKEPLLFCKGNYLTRNWTALIPALSISFIFYLYNQYFWCCVFLIASQGNEIHCWAHMKTNNFIKLLQKYYILQNKKTHALHHKRPYDTNYCVMTMMVNPILNQIHFWYGLEITIYYMTGIRPRKEREIY